MTSTMIEHRRNKQKSVTNQRQIWFPVCPQRDYSHDMVKGTKVSGIHHARDE